MRKIIIGVFEGGKPVFYIGNSIEANQKTIAVLNSIAGEMDRLYQEIKRREGATDRSYIAFDYLN